LFSTCYGSHLHSDVSGNRVLDIASIAQERDAAGEYARLSKSKVAEEAHALIVNMREATICAEFQQLGIALGVFATLKNRSPGRHGRLKAQSVLECRLPSSPWIQAARAAFWNGVLDTVSSRLCNLDEFDITANALDAADQHVVLAILNKLAADGVSNISVGHAFVKHPSIAVKVVESLTASCTDNYLRSLDVTGTLIGNDGAVTLSRSFGHRASGWPKELYLSKCNISDAGCIALFDALLRCTSKNMTPIGTLDLSQNTITDEALAAVAPLMLQLVQLCVSTQANFIVDNCKNAQNRRHSELSAGRQQSCFTIQELDLQSNVISERGLLLLTTPLLCRTVLKQQATALAALVQEHSFPTADVVKCWESMWMRPVIQNLKIGGNLCQAPANSRIIHICGAVSGHSRECMSATSTSSVESVQVWNDPCLIFLFLILFQEILLSSLLEIHKERMASRPNESAQIIF
jgi:hypothetical protein